MEAILVKIIDRVYNEPKLLHDPEFILGEYFALDENTQRLLPLDNLLKFITYVKRQDVVALYRMKRTSDKIKRVYQLYLQSI